MHQPRKTLPSTPVPFIAIVLAGLLSIGCGDQDGAPPQASEDSAGPPTSLLLHNARVYTFSWGEPSRDGTPADDAPLANGNWSPDASAVLLRDGRIVWVGDEQTALSEHAAGADLVDLQGAVVLPGLVDSHTHIRGLGANLQRVNLVGADTEEEIVRRLQGERAQTPPGQWIIGWGWDDGAWAARYPTHHRLSEAFPNNPVVLHSLHGFAIWGNRAALAAANIDADTEAPVGGEIARDDSGEPTGILLNRATSLLASAVPEPDADGIVAQLEAGLEEMARSGYVSVHEAGLDTDTLAAFQRLEDQGRLPLRVYAMLSARDTELLERFIERGPQCEPTEFLRECSVKAYWDGALGSRGARLLDDYSDQPGHRGVSGDGYGFDQDIVRRAMAAGFQVGIHAIGDAGNRETLDFIAEVSEQHPDARSRRHRVEHAQVVHPEDVPRFAELGLIASMQPPHMAEDKAWAEDRLGRDRVQGAYAWRTLRQAGAKLVFSSDLAGSDHDFFYGLHSAVTRQSPDAEPTGGWFPEQAFTVEEAIRGYTSWAAYSAFLENESGTIEPGRFADLTVIDIDPFGVANEDPGRLLDGRILMTITGGEIVYGGR